MSKKRQFHDTWSDFLLSRWYDVGEVIDMDMKKTGQFIQTLRKEMHLTQKELAEKLGCTDKAVSRWETGTGLPDVAILLDLSQTLEVSVNEILRGERLSLDTARRNPAEEKDATAKIIAAADETVIEVLKHSRESSKKQSRISLIFFSLCFLQLLAIYLLPSLVGAVFPTSDPAALLFYSCAVICIAVGFIPNKIKWLYPLFLAVAFFAAIPFSGNESHVYFSVGIFALITSFGIIALCHGILTAVKKLKR